MDKKVYTKEFKVGAARMVVKEGKRASAEFPLIRATRFPFIRAT